AVSGGRRPGSPPGRDLLQRASPGGPPGTDAAKGTGELPRVATETRPHARRRSALASRRRISLLKFKRWLASQPVHKQLVREKLARRHWRARAPALPAAPVP